MTTRAKLLPLLLVVALTTGATLLPTMPGARTTKRYKPASGVTQGSGSVSLLAVAPPPTNLWTVAFVWEYPTNLAAVSNFVMYAGTSPRLYSTNWSAGRSLSNTVTQPQKTTRFYAVAARGTNGLLSGFSNEIMVPPTNLVLTITCAAGGTSIAWATSVTGPWTKSGATSISLTNPTGVRLYRGIGARGNYLVYRSFYQ